MDNELKNYTIQLEQVEVGLLNNPENEELQKLKKDLEEIIQLTQELQTKTEETTNKAQYYEVPTGLKEKDLIAKSIQDIKEFVVKTKNRKLWRVGDVCMVKWNEGEQYAKARINIIEPDGKVQVIYEDYKNRGVTTLAELKEFTGREKVLTEAEKSKRTRVNHKEYMEQKKAKKQEKMKKLEEDGEAKKSEWLSFKAKAIKGKKAGIQTKSIINTSNLEEGKTMTKYQSRKRYTRGKDQ